MLAVAFGWNAANLAGVVPQIARAYDLPVGAIGVIVSAMFVAQFAAQMPAGRFCDRFGARTGAIVGTALIAAGNAVAAVTPQVTLAVAGRILVGAGCAFGFLGAIGYMRDGGSSAFVQGLFGGLALGVGGVAIAAVPALEAVLGWRAPYVSALALAAVAMASLAIVPRPAAEPPRRPGERSDGPVLHRDPGLLRLALLYAASAGLAMTAASWVVEILRIHSSLSDRSAELVGSCTILLAVVSRPFGGWVLRTRPERIRVAVAAGLLSSCLGTVAITAATPAWLAGAGCVALGLGGGIAFSPVFTGAAGLRPDAPAAANGFVNSAALLTLGVGTPLCGLTFSLPGEGRVGFAFIAALWIAAIVLLPTRRELGGYAT